MKNILIAVTLLALTSCSFGIKRIGDLNLVSNRNIHFDQNYELIRSYAGSETRKEVKKEFKKAKSETLEDAINYILRNNPGGELLTNVNIYQLRGRYYLVQGDVWGVKNIDRQYKGWKVGDNVQWKSGSIRRGIITELKNAEEVNVKEKESGIVYTLRYERLTKDY